MILGDSRECQDIEDSSVDFIITLPPYGDSMTTVAYGQFSRLSWQWMMGDSEISKLDKKLLGGRVIKDEVKRCEVLERSKTLREQYEEVSSREYKRGEEVISFYIDIYDSMVAVYRYLRRGKYFVLGNRTVKGVLLRTDLIISELVRSINFKTEEIIYRNIYNKRMPLKNLPTNIKGKASNTILKESIG